MKYEFEETREEELVKDLLPENEDKTLVIESVIKTSGKISIEDCNVVFDLQKGASLEGNKIKFVDSEILFIGSSNKPVIQIEDGDIEFEGCKIVHENPENEVLTNFVRGSGNGRIDVSDCQFYNIQGRFIQSVGTSVYIEKCNIENYVGEFCEVINKGDIKPSVKVTDSSFKKISFLKDFVPSWSDEYKETGKLPLDYDHDRRSPYIIDVTESIANSFSNNTFENCDIGCIRVKSKRGKTTIKGCNFKKSPTKVQNLEDEKFEAMNIYARCEMDVENCKFVQSRGIYCHAQYSKLLIKKCIFDRCKAKNKFRSGIIYIMNEVDEQCINIEECEFKKCQIEGKYSESETGIIYIVAGVPERSQEGSVIIKKCTYNDCKADKRIWGKEKQDGFFGKTITFYREI